MFLFSLSYEKIWKVSILVFIFMVFYTSGALAGTGNSGNLVPVYMGVYGEVYNPPPPIKIYTANRRPVLSVSVSQPLVSGGYFSVRVLWNGSLYHNVKADFEKGYLRFTSPGPLGNGLQIAKVTIKGNDGRMYTQTWHVHVATPGIKETSRGLWIEVNQLAQRVYIMKGNTVVKEVVCSTGKAGTPTPTGIFTIQNRGKWFVTKQRTAGARFWVSFKGWGKYMFHSVVYNPRGTAIIKKEEAKLGSKASRGCIRMPLEDARWFYNNVPAGAKVVIHSSK